ncbi:copper amine oxidase N-terminal domain-containing protein [Saccharibacillus sp. JS10]|uniref:copper amine oxidase N-terminal domain-containing protein n=1 Tax=Saccharibacillus sp. JS10 TaxID=2950552 RepID=UPI00210D3FCE|nr:copper amine oxidase N-terminal domain-containing protein [Saccharibacillus sp. JS10]MCQ4085859.1 copper amine oxidase N-terminal domain-containing protein [Saccharibacillus sp. JS10]
MYKRILWSASLAVLLYGSCVSHTSAASMQVSVDGQAVSFHTQPTVRQNVTMVQFAPIFRSLGIDFKWNGKKQQITATKSGLNMILTVGSKTAYVNGKAVKLQQAPVSINGNIFVPLRFVSEATGATVSLSGNRILIESANNETIVTPVVQPSPQKPTTGTTNTPSSSAVASEEAITDYLYENYDVLAAEDVEYEVGYVALQDDDGVYTINIFVDGYEATGDLYAKVNADPENLYDLTEDFAFDLADIFGLEQLNVHIFLALSLEGQDEEIISDLPEEQILEFEDGSTALIESLFAGSYDFLEQYSEFYAFLKDDAMELWVSKEWE